MYKLEFTLKQHTPIIHFQHDQDGATLKATEVKPKLDRFIIEKLGGKNNLQQKWFNNIEKESLNYKIRIISNNDLLNSKIAKGFPNYLGNMGSTEDIKGFVLSDDIKVQIICYEEGLRNAINQNISNFFTVFNFGSRTSKGFGCFSINNITEKEYELQLSQYYSTVYKVRWNNKSKIDYETDMKFLFGKIQDEYKLLKAGDSRNKKDSKLRLYVNTLENPIEWEKPVMQNDISAITNEPLNIQFRNKDFYYVRAILGLAENYEYLKQKVNVTLKPSDEGIQRFQSPIIFKVYNNNLYLAINPIHNLDLISNKEVILTYTLKGKLSNKITTIQIPDTSKIDLKTFIDTALFNSNWKKI